MLEALVLTFLQTAQIIATVDRMPAEVVPLLVRRIRIFDTKDLVPVQRENTGRREGRLTLTGACMARIFSTLHDFGLDAETLRPLRAKLSHADDISNLDQTELAKAISAIKAGANVTLTMELVRQVEPYKKWHHFRVNGHRPPLDPNSRAARASKMVCRPSLIVEMAATIDLKELLQPFINAYDSAGEA